MSAVSWRTILLPPELEFDPAQPFEAMAKRMVHRALNGGIKRRIETGIYHAKQVKADGAVWFAHWGCKHTLGGAQIAKRMFEEGGHSAAYPGR